MDMYDILLARNLGSGSGGTTNYNALDNKPEINGETLQGDKNSTDLKIAGKIVDGGTGEVFNDYSGNVASGAKSHAEGSSTKARGTNAHAEGYNTIAVGQSAHAEGNYTYASGSYAHVEGDTTTASGTASHTEGGYTAASGTYSHAEGNNTKASSTAQHVQGRYNIEDSTGKYAFIIGNGTATARSNALAVDWNGDIYPADYGKGVNLAQLDTDVAALRLALNAEVYGFRIDKQDSNPETRVEYLYDAVGMTPARMNYTTGTFDYGSWANAWFITGNKPCALKYDGTVDYYLNPDDYTKKADGTASDVSDSSYAGNFMASMPTVWIKRWEDTRYQYVAIANKQISDDFKAYAHDAGDGYINDYIYYPMFLGYIDSSKMRSIAGVIPSGMTTTTQEKAAAEAIGTGWQMWDWSKHCLITDLLTLISRTTDSQSAFGYGVTNTRDDEDTQTHGMLETGSNDLNTGQFSGYSDMLHHVKVFHIEDYWGNRYNRCLGLNRVDGYYKCKPVRPYSEASDSSYITIGEVPTTTGTFWVKDVIANEYGEFPKDAGASASTYFCDMLNTGTPSTSAIAMIGGMNGDETWAGSYMLHISRNHTNALWFVGSSLCYNAVHTS